MTGPLILIDATLGDVTLTEDALFISLQGNPAAPFACTVPTPESGAFYVVNNATGQDASISGPNGNPATAPAMSDTALWVDGLSNGHNLR